MKYLDILIYTGLSFVFLAILFVPMERAFPRIKMQAIFRSAWKLDVTFFLGQYLLWGSLVSKGILFLADYLSKVIPTDFQIKMTSQPIWLQALEVIIISDFLIYWAHRLQHRWDFLWRFHQVHHSAENLDWLAAHREHPFDSIYTIGVLNLPVLVLGFDLNTISILITFRGIWAVYIHSNVDLNLGFMKKIIGSPDLHQWHHDKERNRGNYANLSPLMDIIFGTYYESNENPKNYGIKQAFPKQYLGQLIQPILPAKIFQKLTVLFSKSKTPNSTQRSS